MVGTECKRRTWTGHRVLGAIAALAVGLMLATEIPAQSPDLSKTVDGVTFYLGVIPAEIVRDHPVEHPESAMHGAPPKGARFRHVVIALFDSKTGKRITDAQVRARVEQLGLTAERKVLEPMQIAGTTSYGNYFAMPGPASYAITLFVKRNRAQHEVQARFD
jgi:hypothetical protein